MSGRIILIEDDKVLSDTICYNLKHEGYDISAYADGVKGLAAVSREVPDLLLLDLMLPGMDGIEICRTIRCTHDFPIIILSARASEVDKVLGLEIGADDYISKPFSMVELLARVKNIIRRSVSGDSEKVEVISGGDIVVNLERHEVEVAGKAVDLRPKEFALLEYLLKNKDRVVERDELIDRLWQQQDYVEKGALDVTVRRLREKVEKDPSQPKHIITVRSFGYKFRE